MAICISSVFNTIINFFNVDYQVSCYRRLEKNKSSIELIKRTPDEVKEIAERYEKQKKKIPFSIERNPYANTTQIQIGSHNIRYTN